MKIIMVVSFWKQSMLFYSIISTERSSCFILKKTNKKQQKNKNKQTEKKTCHKLEWGDML